MPYVRHDLLEHRDFRRRIHVVYEDEVGRVERRGVGSPVLALKRRATRARRDHVIDAQHDIVWTR